MEGGGPGTADSSNLESNSAKSDDQEDENQNEEAEIINENDKKDENTEKDDNTDSAIDRDGKTKVANPEVKLCGWLLIFSRGIINTNRSRWFVFGDNTCKLYYYRNPHDLIPLGEIDIAHASFYFDASNTEKPGSFEIRCFGKEYLLDAHDRHTMMYWLQELQKRRKIYNIKKSSLSKERLGQWSVKRPNNLSGLATTTDSEPGDELETVINNGIPRIQVPQRSDLSGSSTDLSGQKAPAWSLTNLKAEIQNVVSNIKKSPSGMGTQTSTWFVNPQPSLSPSLSSPSLTPSPSGSTEDFTIVDHGENLKAVDYNISRSAGAGDSTSQQNNKGKIVSAFKNLKSKKLLQRSSATESTGNSTGAHPCVKCKQLQSELSGLTEEHQATEDELQAHREIVRLLQKEMDTIRKEMHTKDEARSQNEAGLLNMLADRDKHIVELQYGLFTLKEEIEIINQKLRSKDGECKNSLDQMVMFKDMLKAKDEIIVKLTDQVFELETALNQYKQTNGQATTPLSDTQETLSDRSSSASNEPVQTVIHTQSPKEVEKLKDMCTAYELQNQFLTKEILELNELRQNDEINEKNLMIKYTKLEANYYQTQSKYLFLLKELKSPVRGGEDRNSQEAINQLLEDALETDAERTKDFVSSLGQEYDKYGFLKKPDIEDEEEADPLVAKATQLERQSAELSAKIKDKDEIASHHLKWENFMVGLSGKPLHRSTELKNMIRSGIPHEFREEIWKGCINLCVEAERTKLGAQYYQILVDRSNNPTSNPASKQIELDLPRTLPNNKHYECMESDGITKLRNVLLAFSWHNPVIGYCQGLNRLAAIALLFLSEEEAFWCLVAITDHLMPREYYSQTLAGAQTDQRVLKDLLQDKIPKLHYHFEQHSVDISLFTFNWFLTIFVDNNIPPDTFLRVWDTFLYEGSKVLFRFAVAFFKNVEDDMVKQNSALKLNHFFRTMGEKMSNVRRITQLAFHWINPFPMRGISTKRQFYMQQVKGELAELDRFRKDMQTKQQETDMKEYYSDDDL